MVLNIVDLILGIILVSSAVSGLRRGFIRSLFDIFAMMIAVFAAVKWYSDLAKVLLKYLAVSEFIMYILSFVVLWVIFYLAVDFFGGFVTRVLGGSFFAPINMAGGALFGLVKGLAVLLIAVQIIILFPLPGLVTKEFKNSIIFQWTLPVLEMSYNNIYNYVPANIPNINKFLDQTKK